MLDIIDKYKQLPHFTNNCMMKDKLNPFLRLCNENGTVDQLKELLRNNFNVTSKIGGDNALHLVARSQNVQFIEYLLSKIYFDTKDIIHGINHSGNAPSHVVINESQSDQVSLQMFDLLNKYQCDLTHLDGFGMISIHIACQKEVY